MSTRGLGPVGMTSKRAHSVPSCSVVWIKLLAWVDGTVVGGLATEDEVARRSESDLKSPVFVCVGEVLEGGEGMAWRKIPSMVRGCNPSIVARWSGLRSAILSPLNLSASVAMGNSVVHLGSLLIPWLLRCKIAS